MHTKTISKHKHTHTYARTPMHTMPGVYMCTLLWLGSFEIRFVFVRKKQRKKARCVWHCHLGLQNNRCEANGCFSHNLHGKFFSSKIKIVKIVFPDQNEPTVYVFSVADLMRSVCVCLCYQNSTTYFLCVFTAVAWCKIIILFHWKMYKWNGFRCILCTCACCISVIFWFPISSFVV